MSKKKVRERTILHTPVIEQNTVLGLDCSSSTVGWGLTSVKDGKVCLLANGHFKPIDNKSPELVRLNFTFNKIIELCKTFKPSSVLVEDIFLFMKGKSSATTITTLAAFNRVISLAAYQMTNNAEFYSVHQIRNIIKTCYKIKETIPKDGMPDVIRKFLSSDFDNINNIRNVNVAQETFDEADGIAASWAKSLHNLYPDIVNKLLEPKPKKKKKGKK